MTRVSDPPERLASNLTEERDLKDLENALQAAARSVLSRARGSRREPGQGL